MKKILVIIISFSSILLAQQVRNNPYLNLENSINQTGRNNSFASGNFSFNYSSEKKNTGVAVILSLLLPGMGELYADSYSSGKYFTVADVSLWGVYIGMNTYSNWQKSNYKAYAASSAGVNNSNKNADFYANVGTYLNVDEYNNDMALQGNFNQMYNSPDYYWHWQSNTDRKNYRNMWTTGEQAHNNLRFVVGALILNRVISAINAVRLVSSYNKNIDSELSWNMTVGIQNYETLPSQLKLNFQANF